MKFSKPLGYLLSVFPSPRCWRSFIGRYHGPPFILAAIILGSLSACTDPDRIPGISEDEILLGSSAALGGHASFLGTQYTHGAMAWFEEVNASGGIHGRKIQLITYDDGYDPPRTVENTLRLIDNDEVFALFNYVGTPTSVRIIDMVEEARIPAFGFFTGAEELRAPLKRHMFHVRASYFAEAEGAIKYFVDNLGLTKVAVFYQDDAFGKAVLDGVRVALERRQMEISATATYSRGSNDVQSAVDELGANGAQAVIMAGTYRPLAKFIKMSHYSSFRPYFHTVSFVGSKAFGKELITRGIDSRSFSRIIVTQVVPYPFDESLPLVAEYKRLLEKHYPNEEPNYVSLEGFINARVLSKALLDAGPDLTRDKLIATIQTMDNVDIGIGKNIVFGNEDHQGLEDIYYSRMSSDGNFRVFDP